MKIIDLDNFAFEAMTEAPIDEKNICSDFLLDDIYDNQHYVENGKRSVGFVNGYPTLIDYGAILWIFVSTCHFPLLMNINGNGRTK